MSSNISSRLCRMCGYYPATECFGQCCMHCETDWIEKVVEPYKKAERERQQQEKVAAAIAAANEAKARNRQVVLRKLQQARSIDNANKC